MFATLVLVVLTGLQWRAQKESTRLSTRAFRWRVGFVGNNINLGSEKPLAEASPDQSVGVIGATAEYRAATTFTRAVTAQDTADIRGRQGRWMAFGRVTYDDIFGESHYTEYCIEFEPSDGSAKLCAHWNVAT